MQGDATQDVICEELWFEEGNIVIASVDTSRHLFKVHKSVLSTHSPVLRDLFAIPQPLAPDQGPDSSTYEGLPLVIFPDAPKDVHDLLAALYYPTRIVCRRNRRSTFKKVAGVLRLSTKYEISELRNHIKGVLDSDWPSNFEAWEANEVAMNEMMNASREPSEMASKLPHSAEIIQLARECGINSILPAAFYNIARIMSEDCPSDLGHVWYRPSEMDHCSSDVLIRVIEGREALRRHSWDICSDTLRRLGGECAFEGDRRDTCRLKLKEWWSSTAGEYLPIMEDLLGTLRMVIGDMDKMPGEVCPKCRKRLVERIKKDQRDIWRFLPTYFRLEVTPKVPTPDPLDSESEE